MMEKQLFVKIALDSWYGQVKTTDQLLEKLSDADLEREIAPGRNRGIYLLGHLAAVHDLMLPLLRFEDAMYPDLKPVFIDAADKTIAALPTAAELRMQWKTVNDKLQAHFNKLPADEWFTRHSNVSEEDFVKEPHRNRINLLLGRTNHLSYHRGQMALLGARG